MTNADYITINEQGVFVGGKPTTMYRGEEILDAYRFPMRFKRIKDSIKLNHGLDVEEFHVMSSSTWDTVDGDISTDPGIWAWWRVKFADGRVLAWRRGPYCDNARACARFCLYNSMGYFEELFEPFSIRPSVFGNLSRPDSVQESITSDEKVAIDNIKVKQIKLGRFLITVQRRQK